MTGVKTPKVRFVKCPKCWNVLPESVDVPVYRCGGCGTILQAKYRQQDAAEKKLSGLHGEEDDAGDRASDSKGSSTSEEYLSSSPDDLNNVKDVEQDSDLHVMDELKMPCPDISDRSQDITYGDQNNGRIQGETGESNIERHGSNEVTEINSFAEENSLVRGGVVDEQEQQEESEEQMVDSPPLERVMSSNTCASTEYLDPYSTFSGMLSETCKSPTNRSFHHGYDASVSSPEDHFLYNKKPLPLKMKHPRRDKNGLFLPRSYELPPRVPLYQNMPRKSGYVDEAPKNFRQSKSMSYHDSASPEYINEEKIKLLRMVYELEEQLKKTCNLQDSQKHRPMYDSHELFLDSQRHGWKNHHNLRSSRIPFSAEVARVDRFPLPRDRQHSEPLPPPPLYKSIRRGQSSLVVNSYSSWPSSPVHYVDEEEEEEEDLSYEFQSKLKKRPRERISHDLVNKKHLRPIARAAPFIACQNCLEFLQLPEDFLLSKRRCHRVRCGSCSTVMKFSLENRTCLVPYEEDFRGPPPSEAEEYGHESMNMMRTSISNGLREEEDSKGKIIGYSEIEEMPRRLGSPLHQLLGYSTLSQVFKGFGPSSSSPMQRTLRERPTGL